MLETILKRFDEPDEVREFEKGKFELVNIGGMTIGRATYQPGWRWATHVGAPLGKRSCDVEHVGIVVSGRATAEMEDGRTFELAPGAIFYIPPGHDSRVLGDEPYVSLHLLGAGSYAAGK
jgi:quercetin dioxygenase-like cupin family protein